MPKYTGGDITEITFNHPTLGSFNFQTKSNESYTADFGGNRSNDDAGAVTGSGTMIDQINAVRWSFEGVLVADFVSENETKAFNEIAGSPDQGTFTATHISGTVWRGRGKIVGDVQFDTNTSQATIKFAGGGKLEKL